MAKRSTRKIVRVDDVQRTLDVQSSAVDKGAMTIQIPGMLARANRRQYEQARCYSFRLKGIGMGTASARNYEVYTLSNAWWVKKSIEFAKAVWLHSTKEERALLGDRKGKWHDFVISGTEVGAGANHSNLYQYSIAESGDDMTAAEVTADEPLLEDQNKQSAVEGDQDLGAEYEYGFTIAATDVTGNIRSYNIFDQYMLTRQHVTPADTRDAPYKDLFELDQSAMDNLKQDGDNAPFDLDTFPSPWVKQDVLICDAEGSGNNGFTRFIDAPLGVVIVKKRGNDGTTEVNFVAGEGVLLEVKSGRYKGVHAPAYKATKLLLESSTLSKFKQ